MNHIDYKTTDRYVCFVGDNIPHLSHCSKPCSLQRDQAEGFSAVAFLSILNVMLVFGKYSCLSFLGLIRLTCFFCMDLGRACGFPELSAHHE